jgi:hypothetical protein
MYTSVSTDCVRYQYKVALSTGCIRVYPLIVWDINIKLPWVQDIYKSVSTDCVRYQYKVALSTGCIRVYPLIVWDINIKLPWVQDVYEVIEGLTFVECHTTVLYLDGYYRWKWHVPSCYPQMRRLLNVKWIGIRYVQLVHFGIFHSITKLYYILKCSRSSTYITVNECTSFLLYSTIIRTR